MKNQFQWTPALRVALLIASVWTAFWLLAFRPAPLRPASRSARPEVIRLVANNQVLDALNRPTLFALPSAKGFSGKFLENRMDLRLTLENPASPIRYLSNETHSVGRGAAPLLQAEPAFSQSPLPVPSPESAPVVRPVVEGAVLLLTPELKQRAEEPFQLNFSISDY